MSTGQRKPGFIMTRQRKHRRPIALFRMALGAIIAVLRKELSFVMVLMAVRALLMREFQYTSTGGRGIRLMATLTFHQRMFSTELEVGEIMIELLLTHFIPPGGHMA